MMCLKNILCIFLTIVIIFFNNGLCEFDELSTTTVSPYYNENDYYNDEFVENITKDESIQNLFDKYENKYPINETTVDELLTEIINLNDSPVQSTDQQLSEEFYLNSPGDDDVVDEVYEIIDEFTKHVNETTNLLDKQLHPHATTLTTTTNVNEHSNQRQHDELSFGHPSLIANKSDGNNYNNYADKENSFQVTSEYNVVPIKPILTTTEKAENNNLNKIEIDLVKSTKKINEEEENLISLNNQFFLNIPNEEISKKREDQIKKVQVFTNIYTLSSDVPEIFPVKSIPFSSLLAKKNQITQNIATPETAQKTIDNVKVQVLQRNNHNDDVRINEEKLLETIQKHKITPIKEHEFKLALNKTNVNVNKLYTNISEINYEKLLAAEKNLLIKSEIVESTPTPTNPGFLVNLATMLLNSSGIRTVTPFPISNIETTTNNGFLSNVTLILRNLTAFRTNIKPIQSNLQTISNSLPTNFDKINSPNFGEINSAIFDNINQPTATLNFNTIPPENIGILANTTSAVNPIKIISEAYSHIEEKTSTVPPPRNPGVIASIATAFINSTRSSTSPLNPGFFANVASGLINSTRINSSINSGLFLNMASGILNSTRIKTMTSSPPTTINNGFLSNFASILSDLRVTPTPTLNHEFDATIIEQIPLSTGNRKSTEVVIKENQNKPYISEIYEVSGAPSLNLNLTTNNRPAINAILPTSNNGILSNFVSNLWNSTNTVVTPLPILNNSFSNILNQNSNSLFSTPPTNNGFLSSFATILMNSTRNRNPNPTINNNGFLANVASIFLNPSGLVRTPPSIFPDSPSVRNISQLSDIYSPNSNFLQYPIPSGRNIEDSDPDFKNVLKPQRNDDDDMINSLDPNLSYISKKNPDADEHDLLELNFDDTPFEAIEKIVDPEILVEFAKDIIINQEEIEKNSPEEDTVVDYKTEEISEINVQSELPTLQKQNNHISNPNIEIDKLTTPTNNEYNNFGKTITTKATKENYDAVENLRENKKLVKSTRAQTPSIDTSTNIDDKIISNLDHKVEINHTMSPPIENTLMHHIIINLTKTQSHLNLKEHNENYSTISVLEEFPSTSEISELKKNTDIMKEDSQSHENDSQSSEEFNVSLESSEEKHFLSLFDSDEDVEIEIHVTGIKKPNKDDQIQENLNNQPIIENLSPLFNQMSSHSFTGLHTKSQSSSDSDSKSSSQSSSDSSDSHSSSTLSSDTKPHTLTFDVRMGESNEKMIEVDDEHSGDGIILIQEIPEVQIFKKQLSSIHARMFPSITAEINTTKNIKQITPNYKTEQILTTREEEVVTKQNEVYISETITTTTPIIVTTEELFSTVKVDQEVKHHHSLLDLPQRKKGRNLESDDTFMTVKEYKPQHAVIKKDGVESLEAIEEKSFTTDITTDLTESQTENIKSTTDYVTENTEITENNLNLEFLGANKIFSENKIKSTSDDIKENINETVSSMILSNEIKTDHVFRKLDDISTSLELDSKIISSKNTRDLVEIGLGNILAQEILGNQQENDEIKMIEYWKNAAIVCGCLVIVTVIGLIISVGIKKSRQYGGLDFVPV